MHSGKEFLIDLRVIELEEFLEQNHMLSMFSIILQDTKRQSVLLFLRETKRRRQEETECSSVPSLTLRSMYKVALVHLKLSVPLWPKRKVNHPNGLRCYGWRTHLVTVETKDSKVP